MNHSFDICQMNGEFEIIATLFCEGFIIFFLPKITWFQLEKPAFLRKDVILGDKSINWSWFWVKRPSYPSQMPFSHVKIIVNLNQGTKFFVIDAVSYVKSFMYLNQNNGFFVNIHVSYLKVYVNLGQEIKSIVTNYVSCSKNIVNLMLRIGLLVTNDGLLDLKW